MKMIAAAAALVASVGAHAQTTSVTGIGFGATIYQSSYTFSLAGLSNLVGDVDPSGFTLGVGVNLLGSTSGFDADATDGFSFSNLAAGTYTLLFTGYTAAPGGGFGGYYSVSAVPEPETYAMMLAGLGIMGFMAARRRQG